METWFAYFKDGLFRKPPRDRIAGPDNYSGIMKKLEAAMVFSHPALAERQMAEDRRWLLLKQ